MVQRSLVLLKPDAVQRGIVGEILHRFERAGLKVIGAKLFVADAKKVADHYKKDDKWAEKVGNHRLDDAKKHNLDLKEIYGTDNLVEIGHMVNKANVDYLTMGPVFGFVFEGVNAIEKIRKLVGHTFTLEAEPGTIRGDYGLETPLTSMLRKRTVFNMIHASGNEEEAEVEVKMWFSDDELLEYKRVHEDLYKY
jgi:nucleoside-diphosphate kinase